MAYFPFMIEVEGHKALVVGAGQSAKDKIRALTDFGADVTVVAPVISADVVKQGKTIKIERRVYRPGETKGYEIVVAATDNPAVNKQVAHDAARFGAICSVQDDDSRGGFIFPQIIKRNSYSVAVCTDSIDSALAVKIKEKIERSVPEKADEIAALFSKARKELDAGSEKRTRLADSSYIADRSEEVSDKVSDEASDKDAVMPDEELRTDVIETEDASDGSVQNSTWNGRSSIGFDEESVIKVGTLSDRLSQIRADAVISRLEQEGMKCSKVLLEHPGAAGMAGSYISPSGESTTILSAEDALITGEIDIAVRRAGDMPEDLPSELTAAACLPREDARDVLVTKKGTGENEIEVIETDSPSRKVQIEKFLRSGEARVTREGIQAIVNRLKAGETDAAILAASDVERLLVTKDEELESEYIDVDKSLPPACQGITVLETRTSGRAYDAAKALSDMKAMASYRAESGFMKALGADAGEETAAYSAVNGVMLFMKVMRKSGQKCVYFAGMKAPEDADLLAEELAAKMRASMR